jgi:acyl carrier protein
MIKTYYYIQPSDLNRKRIPIGKPIKGTRVIILDKNMNLCNKEIVGELYIRTPYRTFGYYNDSGLNNERFIPNPFNTNPEDIIYKTGDLARTLPDGNIDLLGRIDRQVKIRGIRIQLEEIESVLLQHPLVKEAVVIKDEFPNDRDHEMLCAFITGKEKNTGEEKILTSGLMEYLAEKLPPYMIPACILRIEDLPKKPNGKVDYGELVTIAKNRNVEYIPPGNDVEKKLWNIWAQVLNVKELGVTNSFFELGGNSLNAVSLISKIHREFHIKISLPEIFKYPTIKEQGEIINISHKEEHFILVEPVEKKDYYPLSSAQKRLYVIQQMNPESITYNLPVNNELQVLLEAKQIEMAFKKLIQRHESFRTSFEVINGEPVQRIHNAVEFEIEYYNPGDQGKGVEIIKGFVRPFDLSKAPLLRVGLLPVNNESSVLLVDIHHIISDAFSHDILVNDFLTLCSRENLPLLRLQYKDYAEWQKSQEVKEIIKKQEGYWLKEFERDIPILNLPIDYHSSTDQMEQRLEGDLLLFEIEKEDLKELRRMEKTERVTMFMMMLTIFNLLLFKLSGQEDIIIGTPVGGRTHSDLENIVGMFVNMLAIRNFPKNDMTFREYLNAVKQRTLEAFSNQDYQFDELVNKVVQKRELERHPLFDVAMTFYSDLEEELPNLKEWNSKKDLVNLRSKFNLSLIAIEVKESMVGIFNYSMTLFKKETIERFSGYFRQIVSAVVKNQDILLRDIIISSDLAEAKSDFVPIQDDEIGFGF